MEYSNQLINTLADRHLLKHEFYRDWTAGKLSLNDLQVYSRQYYHHVRAFPRYISATHSMCDDIKARQVLLENLIEEERGESNHPEQWLRFVAGLDVEREEAQSEALHEETQNLINTFFKLCRSSFAEGLGAVFAYEHQIPEIAQSKIDGLRQFYNIQQERTLQFFKVHAIADIEHTKQIASLIENLSLPDREKARKAALEAGQALWNFLDGMQRVRQSA